MLLSLKSFQVINFLSRTNYTYQHNIKKHDPLTHVFMFFIRVSHYTAIFSVNSTH